MAAPKGFGVKAFSPKAVTVGEVLKCVITSLSSASDSDTDSFLLQCEVPKGTVLESVYTGSYNEDVQMDLVCRTEKDGKWHSWGEQISSKTGETFKTDTISFSEGDRICSFALSAAEAPKGFCMNEDDPFCYYVRIVDKDAVTDYSGLTRFTAYMGGQKAVSESGFTTAIRSGVQTGDNNALLTGSFILLAVSAITMIGFIISRAASFRRAHTAEQERLPRFYPSISTDATQNTMSDLMRGRR